MSNPVPPTEFVAPSVTPDAVEVGRTIRALRRQRHLQQADLATAIGMLPAPLCNIENGRNLPSVRTLCRIAAVLEVSVDEILHPSGYLGGPGIAREEDIEYGPKDAGHFAALMRRGIARVTRVAEECSLLTPEALERIETRIADYLALEDLCSVCKRALIPLQVPFSIDEPGAAQLAFNLRTQLGIGTAVVFDYVELLENHGLRILFLQLPAGIESLSFFDSHNDNAFIVLGEGFNPEKQLFRMAFELANLFLFTRNRHQEVEETPATRRFAKNVASFFLMPQEAVRATVAQLGVSPKEWTYELLLRIKHRFGVSAEAFAHRLEEVGVLEKLLRQEFKARIQAHYEATGFSEPDSSKRKLSRNGRFGDLLLCARRVAGDSPELREIERRSRSIS